MNLGFRPAGLPPPFRAVGPIGLRSLCGRSLKGRSGPAAHLYAIMSHPRANSDISSTDSVSMGGQENPAPAAIAAVPFSGSPKGDVPPFTVLAVKGKLWL